MTWKVNSITSDPLSNVGMKARGVGMRGCVIHSIILSEEVLSGYAV